MSSFRPSLGTPTSENQPLRLTRRDTTSCAPEPAEGLGSQPLMAGATPFEAAQAQTLLGKVSRTRWLDTQAAAAGSPYNRKGDANAKSRRVVRNGDFRIM